MKDEDRTTNDVIGTIEGCEETGLYGEPSDRDDALTVIPGGAKVAVDLWNSTSEFYKVCNAAGIEGYLKKQFVKICEQEGFDGSD